MSHLLRHIGAPFPAPRLQLPPGLLRRPLLPSQARGVRRGPATGGTCAPQIRIRETLARAWPEGRWMAVGARGGSPMCWNSQRLCSLREAKHFLHIKKKNVPSCCLVLAGAIFKALPLGGSSGTRGTEALRGWVPPPSPSPRVGDLGSCAVPGPRGWCLDTKPGIQAERRLQLHPTPVARGFGARFAGGTPRCGLGGLFSLRPRSPPTLIFRPQDRPRVLRGPPVWAERSPSSRFV